MIPLTEGHVRLVGSERDEVGAVELYYPGIGWTGICADPDRVHYWLQDDQAAQVVCRQLGYLEGVPQVLLYTMNVVLHSMFILAQCMQSEHTVIYH